MTSIKKISVDDDVHERSQITVVTFRSSKKYSLGNY